MCGIAGVLHFGRAAASVDAGVLARMRDAMAHRGPDGVGLWISPDSHVGLANRRLAIVDPGPLGAQPMANEDGTVRITYNGEIYNHAALRTELVRVGHRFRTDHCDTEVVVHAYEQWGPKCLERLEGMFALGIWDAARARLFLARDRVGIKPLYVCLRPGLALFASEIKALLAHPAVAAAPDPAALYHYLTFLTAPAPLTLFQGIYKLPAGWTLTLDAHGRPTGGPYWEPVPLAGGHPDEPPPGAPAAREAFWVREIRRRLQDSVRAHLVADVPLGVFLSGGLDSSALVALARREVGRPLTTFTVGFSDHPQDNELAPARRVARLFATTHHEVLVDERQMREYLPALVYEQDEPIADWACIPLHYLAGAARAAGVPAVLVGEGSDEQFCGYDLYLRYLRARRYWAGLRRLPGPVRRALAGLAGGAWRLSGRGGHYADLLDRAARDGDLFWGGAVSFWERPKRRLVRRERLAPGMPVPSGLEALVPPAFLALDSAGVVSHYREAVERAFPAADALGRMTYLELKLRLPELLLMRVDKITMAASVEARVPFLDHRLVELTMGLPVDLKVRGGVPKHLLKQVCAEILPRDVIDRPKVGLAAPMGAWLRGEFGRAAEATILASPPVRDGLFDADGVRRLFRRHRAGGDTSLAIWTLYNLAAWYARWIGGTQAA